MGTMQSGGDGSALSPVMTGGLLPRFRSTSRRPPLMYGGVLMSDICNVYLFKAGRKVHTEKA